MHYLLLFLFFCISTLNAQNLVPNPSFENYTATPGINPLICGLVPVHNWFTPSRSTDYYNADFNISSSNQGVPSNFNGYQQAYTGQAYTGLGVYSLDTFNTVYAEHLAVELIDTLQRDSFYRVEIFVSRAEESIEALGDFGILFTNEALGDTTCIPGFEDYPVPIDTEPHLRYSSAPFFDTDNWIPLCWLYKADGTEKFMTFGTFSMVPSYAYSGAGRSMYYYVDDASIIPVPLPIAEPIPTDTVYWCDNMASVELSTTAVHNSYLWSTGEEASSITVSDPGWYWVETYALDCSPLRDSVWVAVLDEAALDVGPPQLSVCPEDLPITLNTGIDAGTFSWNTGSTASSITLNTGGTYTVIQSYPCGIFRDTITVIIDEPVPLVLAPDSLICPNDFIPYTLSANTVYDAYLWSTGDTSTSILVTTPGTYSLTVPHPCGTFTASHTLDFLDIPDLPPMIDTVLCSGESFSFTAPHGYTSYEWSHGPQTASVTLADTGTYTLVARHPCGDASTQLQLTYETPLQLTIPAPAPVVLGERVRLQPQINNGVPVLWQWSPAEGFSCADCPQPWLMPLESGNFQLLVEDQYGCTASTNVSVIVDASKPNIYVPNAFSPNGDGVNDQWTLYPGPAIDDILALEVYDRWGGKVWQLPEGGTPPSLNGWDGKIAGQLAATGVYVWLAQVRLINGEVVPLKGEVMLVR